MEQNITKRPKDSKLEKQLDYYLGEDRLEAEALVKARKLDINAKDENSNTLLSIAVLEEDLERVKKYVKMGADVNALCSQNTTALNICSIREGDPIKEFLLSKGAKTHGEMMLLSAKKGAWTEVVLDEDDEDINDDIYSTDDQGQTLLHHAVLTNNLPMVQKLLKIDADQLGVAVENENRLIKLINLRDKTSHTPLDYCTEKRHVQIKNYLKDQGAVSGLSQNTASAIKTSSSRLSFWDTSTPAKKAGIEILALSAAEGSTCLSILFATDKKFFKEFFSHAGNYETVSGIQDALKTNIGMTTFSSVGLAGLILIVGLYLHNRSSLKREEIKTYDESQLSKSDSDIQYIADDL